MPQRPPRAPRREERFDDSRAPRRVLVKFPDAVDLGPDGGSGSKSGLDVPGSDAWHAAFPGITIERLFPATADRMAELVARARKQDPSYDPPNLRNWIAVTVPAGREPEALLAVVKAGDPRLRAHVEPPPTAPPTVNALDDPKSTGQRYLLSSSEGGVDALYAWGFPGGDGADQSLVDLEHGWRLDHEDLVDHDIKLISGENYNYAYHGTGVLGVIAAVDNRKGCIGLAPRLASIRCVGAYRAADGRYSISEAVFSALDAMDFGHVLVLEVQSQIYGYIEAPAELDPAVFDAVRLATALGIVVVEAAGNAGKSLDEMTDDHGSFVLNPASVSFRDSGAILVGAATSTSPHAPHPDSNHGARVDCFAWGDDVLTLDATTDPLVVDLYGNPIERTSSATAIIAGVAAIVQGLAQAGLKRVFGGWQLRDILSDPAHGTESASPGDGIGVMPDLRKIIDGCVLKLAADVYLRDRVGDIGDPNVDRLSRSPDIIVRDASVADPQAAFGEGSGVEDDAGLSHPVTAGRDHWIYLRMRNRGGVDAAAVFAAVYWAPPTSLLAPDLWTHIGSTILPNVPATGDLTVSGGISWPAAAVPATGHYCFVGLIGHADDPLPLPGDFRDWDDFHRYVGANNNVAWRNFNVVENEPAEDATPAAFLSLPFLIVGAWDRARDMAVELGGRLPRSAAVRLELPREALPLFRIREDLVESSSRDADRVQVPLVSWMEFPEVRLPKDARIQARLLVHVPEALRRHTYEIFVRQCHRGEEVGRVSWQLVPRR